MHLHTVPKLIDFNIITSLGGVKSGECTDRASPDNNYLLLISISHLFPF